MVIFPSSVRYQFPKKANLVPGRNGTLGTLAKPSFSVWGEKPSAEQLKLLQINNKNFFWALLQSLHHVRLSKFLNSFRPILFESKFYSCVFSNPAVISSVRYP